MRQTTSAPLAPDLKRQKRRRLKQLLRASQITLILTALLMLQLQRLDDAAVFFSTSLLLLFVDWAIHKGKHPLATHILLFSLTIMLSVIAWNSSGLHGIITLGFGGILVFSAMLGGRIQLMILLSIMVFVSLVIAFAHQLGINPHEPSPTTIATGIIASSVLIVIGYCAYLMARDYQITAANLSIENTRIRQAMHRIEHLALHNSLTQLPNRTFAENIFNDKRDQVLAHQETMAVLILDVDNLRTINDSLGHHAGDKILKDVAHRLSQLKRSDYFLSHFGGDEFVVIVSGIRRREHITDLCQNLLKILAENYFYQQLEIFCSVSIGAALLPKDGTEFSNLLRKADIALHQAKDNGRNSFYFYQDAQDKKVLDNLSLISDIRKAITEKQFYLYYQPKIELTTHRLCGFEALLRWQHPTQGDIPPNTFIPIAESSGLIVPLGEWVIRSVCAQARAWLDMGFNDFTLAINTSSIQFKRDNIETIIADALQTFGVPAHIIELELTESLIIGDDEKLKGTLANLRKIGLHLTIDDFGTGYSNLGYLKKFAVGTLKIDQSFVRRINHSSENEAIVRAIIQMCASLGIVSVAEGVEDVSTANLLQSMGCTLGQGYYWSPPLSPEEAEQFWRKWLKNSSNT